MTENPKYAKAKMRQIAAMTRILDANWEVIDEHHGRYTNGYSDARVAAEAGVVVTSAGNFRRQAYGNFAEKELTLEERVAVLEAKFAALES